MEDVRIEAWQGSSEQSQIRFNVADQTVLKGLTSQFDCGATSIRRRGRVEGGLDLRIGFGVRIISDQATAITRTGGREAPRVVVQSSSLRNTSATSYFFAGSLFFFLLPSLLLPLGSYAFRNKLLHATGIAVVVAFHLVDCTLQRGSYAMSIAAGTSK